MGEDEGELSRLGAALGAVADVREQETLSLCRELFEAAFPDSVGHAVLDALLGSPEPLRLGDIAVSCGVSRRHVYPAGNVRAVLDRLEKAGMVVNAGTADRPRYSLDRYDIRVQLLRKMYGTVRFERRPGKVVRVPRPIPLLPFNPDT